MRWRWHIGIVMVSLVTSAGATLAQGTGGSDISIGDSLYSIGREALNRNDFSTAAAQFQRVWSKYPSSSYASDARYWQAFALSRLKEGAQKLRMALELLEKQQKLYPKSPVASQADELATRIRGYLASSGDAREAYNITKIASTNNGCGPDVDVRIAALSGLQNIQSADVVIATLRRLFEQQDSCSAPLRERALAILATRPIAEVESIVVLAAADPDIYIRRRAIPLLAQGSSEGAITAMAKLLADERNRATQAMLLSALAYNTNPRARVLLKEFIEQRNQNDALKENAIASLITSACGTSVTPSSTRRTMALGAKPREVNGAVLEENSAYLRELYSSVTSAGFREQIVEGLVRIGGARNTAWLLEIAADTTVAPDIRRTALYATGVIGNGKIGTGKDQRTPRNKQCYAMDGQHATPVVPIMSLVRLYNAISDSSIREQLLYAYARRAESQPEALEKLISIATNDPNIQLRQRAVFWLSQLKNPKIAEVLARIVAP